jgi:hypothetical protein
MNTSSAITAKQLRCTVSCTDAAAAVVRLSLLEGLQVGQVAKLWRDGASEVVG